MLAKRYGIQEEWQGVRTPYSVFTVVHPKADHPSLSPALRPIYKGFPSLPAAEAWLRGDIPRGALVDPKLPDALRWDGVVLSNSLIEKIKSRGQPHRQASKMGHRNRKEYNSTRRSEAVDQELEAFHHTLQRPELARSCGYTTTPDGALVVYTDGSAMENGKRACRAGSGVWWGHSGVASKL